MKRFTRSSQMLEMICVYGSSRDIINFCCWENVLSKISFCRMSCSLCVEWKTIFNVFISQVNSFPSFSRLYIIFSWIRTWTNEEGRRNGKSLHNWASLEWMNRTEKFFMNFFFFLLTFRTNDRVKLSGKCNFF